MKTEYQRGFRDGIVLMTVLSIGIILLVFGCFGCTKEPETHCYECENQYFTYTVCDVTQEWIDEQCDRLNNDNCNESYLECELK